LKNLVFSFKDLFLGSLFLALVACSDSQLDSPQESVFINSETQESATLSDFSKEGMDFRNQKFLASDSMLNYLEPLTVKLQGRYNELQQEVWAELSSFEFHFYTSGVSTPNGSYLKFEHVESEQLLNVYLFNRRGREFQVCSLPLAVSTNGDFELVVQVENDLRMSRFAIWNMYEDPSAQNFVKKDVFNLSTADCTIKSVRSTALDLFGVSSRWGLVINSVGFNSVSRKVPYVL